MIELYIVMFIGMCKGAVTLFILWNVYKWWKEWD
jgi:hypothetical protein